MLAGRAQASRPGVELTQTDMAMRQRRAHAESLRELYAFAIEAPGILAMDRIATRGDLTA